MKNFHVKYINMQFNMHMTYKKLRKSVIKIYADLFFFYFPKRYIYVYS